MDVSMILPATGVLLGAYGAFRSHYISRENAQRDQDIALLKKQSDLFWKMVEQHMTTVLHSPHTPDRDKLLEKIQAGERLTEEEIDALSIDLHGVINDAEETAGNRLTAVFLLACLNRYKQRVEEFANAGPYPKGESGHESVGQSDT